MRSKNKLSRVRTYWPLLLPVIYYVPAFRGYPFPSQEGAFSDLTITHLPNLINFKRAIFEFGQIPFWSPQIMSGAPFAANPLAGIWYFPGWLALFLPELFGILLLVHLHVIWGTVGFYLLARQVRIGHQGALFGAVAFGSMPKLLAHFGAGHITLLFAVPWTPWLLWIEGKHRNASGWRRLFSPGLVLALIFFADVRWALYAGVLWLLWKCYTDLPTAGIAAVFSNPAGRRTVLNSFREAAKQVALAALLGAPLGLPLLEFTRLSARNNLQAADSLVFSLPPARLLGLVIPDFGGFQEWMVYPGIGVLLLSLLGVFSPGPRRNLRFWAWAVVGTLLISLGEYLPGATWLVQLPGFHLLRVPPRALFLTIMGLVILAAGGLDQIARESAVPSRHRASLAVFGFLSFAGSLAVGVILLAGSRPMEIQGWLILLVLTSGWIWVKINQPIPTPVWFAGLLLVSLVDWGLLNQSNINIRPVEGVIGEGAAVAEFLRTDADLFRTYSPSYSLPQHTAALYRQELADGVDPLYLETYGAFMEKTTGVPRTGYSVTIPPFHTGNPGTDNARYTPDPERLGWLNVKYVLAEFDQDSPDLMLRETIGNTRVYENLRFRPRAWLQETPAALVQPGFDPQTPSEAVQTPVKPPVDRVEWAPNQITVTTQGPGLLVLSEIAYPGWRVRVDEQEADLVMVEDLLRGVVLDTPGAHRVTFNFRPTAVYGGVGLSLTGIFGLIWSVWRAGTESRSKSRSKYEKNME